MLPLLFEVVPLFVEEPPDNILLEILDVSFPKSKDPVSTETPDSNSITFICSANNSGTTSNNSVY